MALLEAVAALAIVGMTAAAALGAAGADLRAAARARRVVEAQALATERVARLALLAAPELERLPDSVAAGRFDPPLADYGWATEARPRAGEPGLYDVTVRVAWAGGAYALRTRLFRRPRAVDLR